MKKFLLIGLVATLFIGCSGSKDRRFQTVSNEDAVLLQKGEEKSYCKMCGMHLPTFYKTNHAADTKNGVKQYCSIHCAVDDHEHHHSDLHNIKVVDTNSLEFIKADSAIYVVGSSKKGTMSMVSKYAFSNEDDAKAFMTENGGQIMNFKEAYELAKADFDQDMSMINDKKGMARFMGRVLYFANCDSIEQTFTSTIEAKSYILENKKCSTDDEQKLHAISIYLTQE